MSDHLAMLSQNKETENREGEKERNKRRERKRKKKREEYSFHGNTISSHRPRQFICFIFPSVELKARTFGPSKCLSKRNCTPCRGCTEVVLGVAAAAVDYIVAKRPRRGV